MILTKYLYEITEYSENEKEYIRKSIEAEADYFEKRALKNNMLSDEQLKEMGEVVWKRIQDKIHRN